MLSMLKSLPENEINNCFKYKYIYISPVASPILDQFPCIYNRILLHVSLIRLSQTPHGLTLKLLSLVCTLQSFTIENAVKHSH